MATPAGVGTLSEGKGDGKFVAVGGMEDEIAGKPLANALRMMGVADGGTKKQRDGRIDRRVVSRIELSS